MPDLPIRSFAVSALLLRKMDDRVEVLLMKRVDTLVGAWCHVAGKIEADERAWETALREIHEETGLVPDRFYSADFCEQFYEADRNCISLLPVFVGFVAGTARVELNGEHSDFAWLSFADAVQRVSFGGQRQMLAHIEQEFVVRTPPEHLRIATEGAC